VGLGVRIAARLAAAASGLVLVLRAIHGPFEWMHSPMNAESVFALAILVLAVLASEGGLSLEGQPMGPAAAERLNWWSPLSLIVIVAAAFAWSSHDYFLSDDFVMLRHARTPFTLWTYTHGGGDGFFRPLIYDSFRLVWPWAGVDSFRWHLTGFALHAVNSILVLLLARVLGFGRFAAWFAGALFAIHATRPETVEWITGRYDLIATFFVLLALVLFLNEWRWLALIAMTAGLLCKESAYACPLLLVLLAPRRWRAWMPFFVVAGALFLYRFWLFGGIGGYKTATGEPQALSIGVVTVFKALVLRLWAVLFFPVNWSVSPDAVLLAVALVVYVGAMIWLCWGPAGSSRQKLVVAIGFVIVAALPPVQQLLIGADLQKARYLYLPSVGFCLLFATLTQHRGRAGTAAAVAILAFNSVALFHNLTGWHDAATQAKAYCAAEAEGRLDRDTTPPPNSVNGVYLFQNGLPECIEMAKFQK
jgi:hypothetical protein